MTILHANFDYLGSPRGMNGVRNRENAESEMLKSRFPVVKIFHIAARFLHRNGGFLDFSADDILQAECGMKRAECHILCSVLSRLSMLS